MEPTSGLALAWEGAWGRRSEGAIHGGAGAGVQCRRPRESTADLLIPSLAGGETGEEKAGREVRLTNGSLRPTYGTVLDQPDVSPDSKPSMKTWVRSTAPVSQAIVTPPPS